MKPVSQTAYYCCGVRMQDAESARPLVGDNYAKMLMGKEGMEYWEDFKQFKIPNAGNLVRHYLIDNNVKKLLQQQPGATVILIGAGLDSRAYRFGTGSWIELDEPAIIEYKNQSLPAKDCKNKLERIAIDFENERLYDKLEPFAQQQNTIIIIEGVLMYLTAEQKNELLKTLTGLFPKHILFCDLMKKNFFDKAGKSIHEKLVKHGSSFTDMSNEPNKIFFQYGYQQTGITSTVKTAVALGLVKIPKFVVNVLFSNFMMGYSVYSFSYGR